MINYIKSYGIWVLGLVALILASLLFVKCERENVLESNITALNSSITTYKLKNGQLVSSVKTLNYTKSELEELVLEKDKKIKLLADKFVKPKVIIQTITNTVIDSILVPYDVPVPYKFTRTGSVENVDYSFNYKSNENGVSMNNLKLATDTLSAVLGVKRKWIFGKETTTLDLSHTNKNIKESSILVIQTQEKKKFYDTNLFKYGVGFFAGLAISKQ